MFLSVEKLFLTVKVCAVDRRSVKEGTVESDMRDCSNGLAGEMRLETPGSLTCGSLGR